MRAISAIDGTPSSRRKPWNEPPIRPVLEEIGNSVTHGIGALLGIVGLILLLYKSPSPEKTSASLIYGICLILLFLMSCLYHAWPSGSMVKYIWRRFDYCSIYLLIGGTFAPYWLVWVGGSMGILFLCIQWVLILTGITFVGVFGPGRLKPLHMSMYLVLGWSALAFFPSMFQASHSLTLMTLLGGVAYTAGIIPFALKSRGSHFIWHIFVLIGALCHFIGIFCFMY
ncbi:MAG: hemolysin III family protein [Clostridia bacterium]|nr:hemolysin III family protein [Clostridia bacterium]